MKKCKLFLILTLLLCLIPCCVALAKTGKVTATSLNMRKSADSDSKVVKVLKEGAEVTIKDTSGNWYKVSAGGETGYVYKKYIKVTEEKKSDKKEDKKNDSKDKKSDKSEKKKDDGTCGPGDTGSAVKKVQKKLKSLCYYTGSIDGDYGKGTKSAVQSFQ